MSVDDRLKAAFAAHAASWSPPVESSLDRVRHRARRTVQRLALAAALVLVVAGIGVVALIDHFSPILAEPANPAPANASPGLVGQLVAPATTPTVLAGRWTLTLAGDGRMTVAPPSDYSGVVSGALFSSTDSEFRTTLFQTDVCSGSGLGTYAWVRSGDTITFSAVQEDCAARGQFFTDNRWRLTR